MMSLESIREIDRQKAADAAAEGLRPMVMTLEDWTTDMDLCKAGNLPQVIRQVPHLGDFDSPRWEPIETFFVDMFGGDLWDAGQGFVPPGTLPCLGLGQLCEEGLRVTRENGYAGWYLHNVGQFQGHISAVKKLAEGEERRDPRKMIDALQKMLRAVEEPEPGDQSNLPVIDLREHTGEQSP